MNPAPESALTASHPAPHRARAPGWQLLLALFLAPAALAVQVTVAYVVAARMCAAGAAPQLPLVALQLAAVVTAAIGFGFALVLWRRTRHEKPGDASAAIDSGDGRTRFLALCGLYGSSLFLFAVLLEASAVAFFGACPGLPVPA